MNEADNTVSIKKTEGSRIEITGEIPAELFEKHRENAMKKLGENIELPGFRKGKVPQDVLKKNISEHIILQEMAELTMAEHYPKIIEKEKIAAIGRPEILITKIAANNPLGFKIIIAILPEVTLPDYRKVAKKHSTKIEKTEISDEDVDKAILELRKMRAYMEAQKNENKEKIAIPDDPDKLPALDDDFVKQLGNFKNVQELREKLKENIKLENENKAREKNRLAIMEALIEETQFDVPEILIEAEIEKIMYKLTTDITNAGVKLDEYLKQINKTEEDLRKEWRNDAEKKTRLQLIVGKIALVENIQPDKNKADDEVKKLKEQYPEADPHRTRAYVEMVLVNEAVFNLLEGNTEN